MNHNKFNAVKCSIDGFSFDSKAEGRRYCELKLLASRGLLSNLHVHPKFDLMVNNQKICRYIADFEYIEHGIHVSEDVKGGFATQTPSWKIKFKLAKVLFPAIEFRVYSY